MSPRISVQPKQKSPTYQYQPTGAAFYFEFRFLKESIRKKKLKLCQNYLENPPGKPHAGSPHTILR